MTDSPEFRRQQAEMQDLRVFLENTMTENKQPDRLDVEMQRFAELRRQAALIEELRDVIVACKKELDLMPKSFAYDIHPGRQIDRVLAKVDAQS